MKFVSLSDEANEALAALAKRKNLERWCEWTDDNTSTDVRCGFCNIVFHIVYDIPEHGLKHLKEYGLLAFL